MVRPMRTIRILATALAFLSPHAGAVNAAGLPAREVSPFVRMSVAPGMTRAVFVARTQSVFERLDADADGYLDAADALVYGQGQAALARAANVSRLLAFDLDGDARVDLFELVSGLRRGLPLPDALSGDPGSDPAQWGAAAMASLDRDANGRITVQEMLAIGVSDSHINPVGAFLLAFPTPDGRLQKGAFVQEMLAQAFDAADADRDGTLSRQEVEAVSGRPSR
jgi:Ca2+-binding EF-hand superfamily protein